MNLIRRLRNRETLNNKQSFVYTANLLQALANQPLTSSFPYAASQRSTNTLFSPLLMTSPQA